MLEGGSAGQYCLHFKLASHSTFPCRENIPRTYVLNSVINFILGSTFSSDQDYAEITVTLGHYVELRCCASSFSKIVWYKEEGKTWNPVHLEPARFNPLAPTLAEEGQVLVVKSARENDAGNYKCVLEKDGRDVDKRIMALTVSGVCRV